MVTLIFSGRGKGVGDSRTNSNPSRDFGVTEVDEPSNTVLSTETVSRPLEESPTKDTSVILCRHREFTRGQKLLQTRLFTLDLRTRSGPSGWEESPVPSRGWVTLDTTRCL